MTLHEYFDGGGEARLFRLRGRTGTPADPSDRLVRFDRSTRVAASAVPNHPALLPTMPLRADASVVPLLRGATLAQHLDVRGPLRPAHTLMVLASVSSGLMALHEAGLVHLDIKPDNIMIDGAGGIIVIDTSGVGPADGRAIRRGTPPFTVPGAAATPATDWVALGRTVVMLATESATTPVDQLALDLQGPVAALLEGRRPELNVEPGRLDLPALKPLASHHRPTIDFFPSREPVADSTPVQRVRRPLAAVAVSALALASFGALVSRDTGCPTRSSDTAGELRWVDLGAECPTAVAFDDTTGVLTVWDEQEANRFGVGLPGDQISFGDWNCDTQVTPGLRRGDQLLVFDHWPGSEPVHARPATDSC